MKIKKKERAEVFMYNYIVVKDCRPDKSKLGYVRIDAKANPRRIVLPKEGEAYINEIFNEAIQPLQGTDTLVVLLNTIWFNETRTTATAVHKHVFGPEKLVSSCYINADILVKKDNRYIPIGSVDSVIVKKGEWLANNCDKLLESATLALLSTADFLWSHVGSIKAVYTPVQLDSLITGKFDYAILKAGKPAKGIYFTCQDFLSNKPANIDFEVISPIKNNIKYSGNNKNDSLWGYSDGENIFMHIDQGYYLLNRAGNTFEVAGPAIVEYANTFLDKTINVATDFYFYGILLGGHGILYERGSHSAIWGVIGPSHTSIEYYKFFHLNMKNGMLY